MKRYYDKNGKVSGWLSNEPTEKELQRENIDMLFIIAKSKRGFKRALINFLTQK